MMQPGLTVEDCPNKNTCGTVIKLTEEEEFELYVARLDNAKRRVIEKVTYKAKDAAKHLLIQRGCPQTPQSLGLTEKIVKTTNKIEELATNIERFSENQYIAPREANAHIYIVNRGYNAYQYNKLTSQSAIFLSQIDSKKDFVKVIHLSKNVDSRNFVGRTGIERRNRLLKIHTLLKNSLSLLEEAISLTEEDIDHYVTEQIAKQIIKQG